MWMHVQRFFQFNRRERIAILVWLGLLFTGMSVQAYRGSHDVKTDFDQAAFQAAVGHLQSVQDSLARAAQEKAAVRPVAVTVEQQFHTEKKITSGQININTADVRQLSRIPRIGTRMAERIIAFRTHEGAFRSVEDLRKVSGIGDKTLAKIKPYIRIN